jgi:hypothetical protein
MVYIVFPLSFGRRASGLSSFSVVPIYIVTICFSCLPVSVAPRERGEVEG